MTTLTFATLTLPAASLGPENPLPVLAPPHRPSKPAGTYDPSLTEEDTRHFGYGRVGMLPHRLQDGYDRRRRPRTLRTAVLENGILRATFVPAPRRRTVTASAWRPGLRSGTATTPRGEAVAAAGRTIGAAAVAAPGGRGGSAEAPVARTAASAQASRADSEVGRTLGSIRRP